MKSTGHCPVDFMSQYVLFSAKEISGRQEVVDALEAEINARDVEIGKIHACLKDAEQMLVSHFVVNKRHGFNEICETLE